VHYLKYLAATSKVQRPEYLFSRINEVQQAAYSARPAAINEVLQAAYRCPSSCYQSAASCSQVPVQLLSTKCCKLLTGARPAAFNEVLPAASSARPAAINEVLQAAYRCPSSCCQRSAASCLRDLVNAGELRGSPAWIVLASSPSPPAPRPSRWLASLIG
jgi:hypothetical protein